LNLHDCTVCTKLRIIIKLRSSQLRQEQPIVYMSAAIALVVEQVRQQAVQQRTCTHAQFSARFMVVAIENFLFFEQPGLCS
jgi:hypothetical protein